MYFYHTRLYGCVCWGSGYTSFRRHKQINITGGFIGKFQLREQKQSRTWRSWPGQDPEQHWDLSHKSSQESLSFQLTSNALDSMSSNVCISVQVWNCGKKDMICLNGVSLCFVGWKAWPGEQVLEHRHGYGSWSSIGVFGITLSADSLC